VARRPGGPEFALDAPQPIPRSPAVSVSGSAWRLFRVAPVKIPRAAVDDADLCALGPTDRAAQTLGHAADEEGFGEGRPIQPRLVVAMGAEHPYPELIGREIREAVGGDLVLCCSSGRRPAPPNRSAKSSGGRTQNLMLRPGTAPVFRTASTETGPSRPDGQPPKTVESRCGAVV